jgi:hypothetical protein
VPRAQVAEVPLFLYMWDGAAAIKRALLGHFEAGKLRHGDMDPTHLLMLEDLRPEVALDKLAQLVELRDGLE